MASGAIVFGYRFVPYEVLTTVRFRVQIVPDIGSANFQNVTLLPVKILMNGMSENVTVQKIRFLTAIDPNSTFIMKVNLTMSLEKTRCAFHQVTVPFTKSGEYNLAILLRMRTILPGTYLLNISYSAFFETRIRSTNSWTAQITIY